jgi:hypothetical protein
MRECIAEGVIMSNAIEAIETVYDIKKPYDDVRKVLYDGR